MLFYFKYTDLFVTFRPQTCSFEADGFHLFQALERDALTTMQVTQPRQARQEKWSDILIQAFVWCEDIRL